MPKLEELSKDELKKRKDVASDELRYLRSEVKKLEDYIAHINKLLEV